MRHAPIRVGIALWLLSLAGGPVAVGAEGAQPRAVDLAAGPSLRDAVVEQLSSLQQELAKSYPASFGGLWVNDVGHTTVAVVGDQSEIASAVSAAKLLGPVSYKAVSYSEAGIRAAHLALRESIDYGTFSLDGMKLATVAEDLMENRVIVSVVGDVAKVGAANLAKSHGSIVLYKSVSAESAPVACIRVSCGNPMKAGLQLYNSAGGTSCISNFTWRSKSTPFSYYLGSAGHCHSVGNQIRHPSGTQIGFVTYSTWGPSAGVDASLTNILPANASNQIYLSGSVSTITSRETVQGAVIGEPVCASKLSGYTCPPGHLVQKGVDTCCAMDEFSATGLAALGGDSGSPVFYSHKAQGILSANNCGSSSLDCYSPVQMVEIWKNFLVVVTN